MMNGIRKDALKALMAAYAPLQRFIDTYLEEVGLMEFPVSREAIFPVTEKIEEVIKHILELDGYKADAYDDVCGLVIDALEEGKSADWLIGKAEDFIREHKEAQKQ